MRWVPIFPELRPYLEEVFERADEGTVSIITRNRDTNANLRTQLTRIIRHAGLEPWPKLFHNLRASRETLGRAIPDPRGLHLDRQYGEDCRQALLASDRGLLCPGCHGRDERRKIRLSRTFLHGLA